MERRVLLAITLSFLVLFLIQRFVMPPPEVIPSSAPQTVGATQSKPAPGSKAAINPAANQTATAPVAAAPAAVAGNATPSTPTVTIGENYQLLPKGWQMEELTDGVFLFSTGLPDWGDTDYPPPPHPWVIASKSAFCANGDTGGQPIFDFKEEGRVEAMHCRGGVYFQMGYWEMDSQRRQHVDEMLRIFEAVFAKESN